MRLLCTIMISLFEKSNKIPKEANDIEEIKKILLKNPSPRSFHVNLSNTEQTHISEAV